MAMEDGILSNLNTTAGFLLLLLFFPKIQVSFAENDYMRKYVRTRGVMLLFLCILNFKKCSTCVLVFEQVW